MNVWIFIFLLFEATRCCLVIVGGESYDLSSLETEGTNGIITVTPPAGDTSGYAYQTSFCANLVGCQAYIKGNIIQSKDTTCHVYGKWSTGSYTKTKYGFQADFKDTSYCISEPTNFYESYFNFLCDPSAGDLGKLQVNSGSTDCILKIDVYTNLVCEGSTPFPSGSGGGGGGGLSGGSIFLISLLSLVVIYVIVGLGLGYYKVKAVAVPHRSFWCDKLPYWTRTGCITSWICTLSCSKSAYRWCCVKFFKANPEDDKMATGLIEGEDESLE